MPTSNMNGHQQNKKIYLLNFHFNNIILKSFILLPLCNTERSIKSPRYILLDKQGNWIDKQARFGMGDIC